MHDWGQSLVPPQKEKIPSNSKYKHTFNTIEKRLYCHGPRMPALYERQEITGATFCTSVHFTLQKKGTEGIGAQKGQVTIATWCNAFPDICGSDISQTYPDKDGASALCSVEARAKAGLLQRLRSGSESAQRIHVHRGAQCCDYHVTQSLCHPTATSALILSSITETWAPRGSIKKK